jgi:hypothetical protein
MTSVVCVHGIGQQLLGEETLLGSWRSALLDGLTRSGATGPGPEVAMAFYGDLFRTPGRTLAPNDPLYTADDVAEGLEQELLAAWWAHAAEVDNGVAPPGARTLAGTPKWVQRGLRQLSNSPFFAKVALRGLVSDLKQVARYLTEPATRTLVRNRVMALIGPDTRVVVAHSLGSVVAYEALCASPGHDVRAFVTLGSPLGIRNLVFDRLEPGPAGGLGAWPGDSTPAWTNIADEKDVVALEKDLRPRFGERVRNVLVHNGAHAHSVVPYLTDALTGAAVAAGLT